jgi:hypothetical protein
LQQRSNKNACDLFHFVLLTLGCSAGATSKRILTIFRPKLEDRAALWILKGGTFVASMAVLVPLISSPPPTGQG